MTRHCQCACESPAYLANNCQWPQVRALWVQEPVQKKEEKQLTAATNGNLPWKRRGGATAGGYLSRSLL
jgi:hypothetical protein